VVFIGCVLYTIVTTPERPPAQPIPPAERSAFRAILEGVLQMPPTMRRLAFVQFFTWLGLFCLWLYFTPAVALRYFGGEAGSPAYTRGVEWAGVCLATYNGVAFAVSFALVALARRGVGTRTLHRTGLVCAAAGLLSVGLWTDPHLLLISMVGVGIGWAAILSMPYALLANAIPPDRMGFYMGVFNFFIVLPQIVAAAVLGPVVAHLFAGRGLPVVLLGGGCFLVAAVGLSWVPDLGRSAQQRQ
jgi:maltose/moltooligosaccharide transporter